MVTSREFWKTRDFESDLSPRQPVRTAEEATPEDVRRRKEERVQELRNDIERYKKYIAEARAEIKAWESL